MHKIQLQILDKQEMQEYSSSDAVLLYELKKLIAQKLSLADTKDYEQVTFLRLSEWNLLFQYFHIPVQLQFGRRTSSSSNSTIYYTIIRG